MDGQIARQLAGGKCPLSSYEYGCRSRGKSGRFRRYREVALEYAFLFDLVGIKE